MKHGLPNIMWPFDCIFKCCVRRPCLIRSIHIYIYIQILPLSIDVCLYVYVYIYIHRMNSLVPSILKSEVLLSGNSSECRVPGGFGATGQPNDGWHQFLHVLTKSYGQCAVGWGRALQMRRRLDELNMGVQSSVSTKPISCILCKNCASSFGEVHSFLVFFFRTSLMTALRADAYALKSLDQFQKPNCT